MGSQQKLESLLTHYMADNRSILEQKALRNCVNSVNKDKVFEMLKDVRNEWSYTCIHRAAHSGDAGTLQCLLENLTQSHRYDLVKIQNNAGRRTALHWAAFFGHTDVVKHLLNGLTPEQQLDLLNIQDKQGHTTLDHAVEHDRAEAAAYIRSIWSSAQSNRGKGSADRSNNPPQVVQVAQSKAAESTIRTQQKTSPPARGGGHGRQDNGTLEVTVKELQYQLRGLQAGHQRMAEDLATVLDLPTTWKAPFDVYHEFTLNSGTAEYNEVKNQFMSSVGGGVSNVVKVIRVQNPELYRQYLLQRAGAAKKLGKKKEEVEKVPLWHGTNDNTVSKITSGKFDRGLSGKNATVYGRGAYFARDASYSAQSTYSPPNANGHRFIIYTRVVTGEWCKGDSDMRAAPYKTSNPTQQYDSVVNDVANPAIFVVFDDTAAYPEYIIEFK